MKTKIFFWIKMQIVGALLSKRCPADVTGFAFYYWMRFLGHDRNTSRTLADVAHAIRGAK